MRAELKRRNHTIGAKWLRQGGSFPVENSAVDVGDKGGDAGVVVSKEREYNPMISGDSVGGVAGGGLVASRVIVGNRKDRVFENANNQEIISRKIVERENEDTEIESIGLSILDPKRRRGR